MGASSSTLFMYYYSGKAVKTALCYTMVLSMRISVVSLLIAPKLNCFMKPHCQFTDLDLLCCVSYVADVSVAVK